MCRMNAVSKPSPMVCSATHAAISRVISRSPWLLARTMSRCWACFMAACVSRTEGGVEYRIA